MALLSPAIVEAVLDGRQPAELTLGRLLKPFPVDWKAQEIALQFDSASKTRTGT